jgi:hypothetical protein
MDDNNELLRSRMEIAELMLGWMHRDLGQWDELLKLFHPDATIEVTWFSGKFTDFVEGSRNMSRSSFRTKHFISQPLITFAGDRAIAETNAAIIGENDQLKLGCVAHNRFYDRLERREGVWKILRRQSVYDFGYFTFPTGVVEVDQERLKRYPREYAPLAWLLGESGFPVQRTFATRGSALEREMKSEAEEWLRSERDLLVLKV